MTTAVFPSVPSHIPAYTYSHERSWSVTHLEAQQRIKSTTGSYNHYLNAAQQQKLSLTDAASYATA